LAAALVDKVASNDHGHRAAQRVMILDGSRYRSGESHMPTAYDEVMAVRGRGMPAGGEVAITSTDPVLSTRFRIGETAAAVLGGVGVAVNDIWEIRTGRRQKVSIDVRHAAAGLRSVEYLERKDAAGKFQKVKNPDHNFMRSITQPWQCKDGRWVLTHFGLPNLKARMSKLLGLTDPTPETVAAAVAKWNALDLEAAIDEHRVCGGMVRTYDEWLATPHGQVLAKKPIVEVIKIGDSKPEAMPKGDRPLSGIRALDLTRILAGPICGRTLAEHGAEVLMITAERLPQIAEHVIDTSHGKRSTFLDLADAANVTKLKELAKTADVFSQGYRPGMIKALGFGPEELAQIRPGIIYASISCYGADGPFSHRGGWEQVAQTMTGICHDNNPARPHLLPAAACDYTTGYLAAYGILLALARRATEGGSYHVRASLCQSGMFIQRQGKVDFPRPDMEVPEDVLAEIRMESVPKNAAPIRHLGPLLKLSETPPRWIRPTPVLGGDRPEWPAPSIAPSDAHSHPARAAE
jgi:crotonobetainyl-CoA:carnitine CoA-transferase CaiB-like acyl-CoA transferase